MKGMGVMPKGQMVLLGRSNEKALKLMMIMEAEPHEYTKSH